MVRTPQKLRDLLDLLAMTPDRTDRIQILVDIADRFREVPERIARRPFPESRKTPACESDAYVWAEDLPDGTLKFHFAVENPQGISARAMAVVLDETLSGEPLEEVLAVSPDVVFAIFGEDISLGKGMGLMGMVHMVHNYARRRVGHGSMTDRGT